MFTLYEIMFTLNITEETEIQESDRDREDPRVKTKRNAKISWYYFKHTYYLFILLPHSTGF